MKTKMMIAFSFLGIITLTTNAQTDSLYLGLNPPGNTAEMFAPGIISKANSHCTLVISPDGKEIFWNIVNFNTGEAKIYSVVYSGEKWSDPEITSFSKIGVVTKVVYSPDGKKLFFDYRDSVNSERITKYVEKTDTGWSEPMTDGFLVDLSSSFTSSGKMYYEDTMTNMQWVGMYSADYSDTGLSNIQPLPEIINTPDIVNYAHCIARDESFLLFTSNRPVKGDDQSNMYIHISFNNNGVWSIPQKINGAINFSGKARLPSISPDGKYLFFCGDDRNFYWVDIKALEILKPTSIGETKYINDVSIFPNPTTGQLNISFSTAPNRESIAEIYNTEGRLALSKIIKINTDVTIDLTCYPKGFYLIKLSVDDEIFTEKMYLQ